MLIDSWFALFGLESGPTSAWLCCTLISHIFHDCVGYCTANHMCYPLSCAVAMASFFPPSLGYCRQLYNTFELLLISLSACFHAILWSSLGCTSGGISWHYLAVCAASNYQAICVACYLLFVCFAYTLNPCWLIEFWLVAQRKQREQEFLMLCTLDLGLCLSSLPE